jgi:superfamily II RNA helicase
MAEPIKFTEEEKKQVVDIRNNYQNVQLRFGEFALYKLKVEEDYVALEKLEENLRTEYKSIQKSEQELIDGLTKKYGTGTLNPGTGEFTPDTPAEKTEKPKK